jgi:hypothetical protein
MTVGSSAWTPANVHNPNRQPMNTQVLIDSIVRQVTVLIAQLATSGGIRAPLAHIANQVFVDLANELEAQGVSRKVSADMFGMALRAYIRKLRRLSEGNTEQGRTLWQAVLEFVRSQNMVARTRVLQRFSGDDELQVNAVLHDLVDSGLVFASGVGLATVYRAATDEELGELTRLSTDGGLDELVWVLIYRSGPVSQTALETQLGRASGELSEVIGRLITDGRVLVHQERLTAVDFVIPLGATVGWEAAVFDHFQAVVQTISQRLRQSAFGPDARDWVGGSTYTFDVWPTHPLEHEVKATLTELRRHCGALRTRVSDYNREHALPTSYQQVVTYLGQCALERDLDNTLPDHSSDE